MPAPVTSNPPALPLPFSLSATNTTSTTPASIPPLKLLQQGAEALIYQTCFLSSSIPCALKHRPTKAYRHPTLDARLTRHRVLSEARALAKLGRASAKDGSGALYVPAVYALDWDAGWMMLEWIEGETVGSLLRRLEETGEVERQKDFLEEVMRKIGRAVGKMHELGVVHGDLTTSNIMVKPKKDGPITDAATTASGGTTETLENRSSVVEETEVSPIVVDLTADFDVVLIDFGLASQNIQDEDRAVDLYVLERAFGSAHARTEALWQVVLSVYGKTHSNAKPTLRRLDEVRMRGRKKIMIG